MGTCHSTHMLSFLVGHLGPLFFSVPQIPHSTSRCPPNTLNPTHSTLTIPCRLSSDNRFKTSTRLVLKQMRPTHCCVLTTTLYRMLLTDPLCVSAMWFAQGLAPGYLQITYHYWYTITTLACNAALLCSSAACRPSSFLLPVLSFLLPVTCVVSYSISA